MADDEFDGDYDEEYDDQDVDESEEDDEEEYDEEDEEDSKQETKAQIDIKLKKIQSSIDTRLLPIYVGNERKTLEQGKKVNPALTRQIELQMFIKKSNFTRNIITIVGPALGYILLACLVLLIIISAVAAIMSIFENRRTPAGDDSMSFGLNGEQIYSARVIYTDDIMAKNRLVADYGKLIVDAVAGYNSASGDFEIDVTYPAEEGYDYSLLFDGYSQQNYGYKRLAQLTYDFASVVNGEYGLNKVFTSYAEMLDDIQYFGLENSVALSAMQQVANDIVRESWYTVSEDSSAAIDSTSLASAMLNEISDQIGVLTQKQFVMDYQLQGTQSLGWFFAGEDDDHPTRHYLSVMYFAKKQFDIGVLSYMVVAEETGEITVVNGENSYNLTARDVDTNNYTYELENANLTIQQTEQSKVALTDGGTIATLYSQLKLANSQDEIDRSFTSQDVDGKTIYSFVPNGFYATFNFAGYFDVADYNNMYS